MIYFEVTSTKGPSATLINSVPIFGDKTGKTNACHIFLRLTAVDKLAAQAFE